MVLLESEKKLIQKKIADVSGDVELIVFSQEYECRLCKETKELVLELGTLSEKIHVRVNDFVKNSDEYSK